MKPETIFSLFFMGLMVIVFMIGVIKFTHQYRRTKSGQTLAILMGCQFFMTMNLLAFGLTLGHWLRTH